MNKSDLFINNMNNNSNRCSEIRNINNNSNDKDKYKDKKSELEISENYPINNNIKCKILIYLLKLI